MITDGSGLLRFFQMYCEILGKYAKIFKSSEILEILVKVFESEIAENLEI